MEQSGSKVIADYMHQELVRLHGERYGLLGQEERQRLFGAGIEFNKRFPVKLLAHGVDSTRFQTLTKIFLDGRLRHQLWRENYGELGVPYNGIVGHWDFGQGLFVAGADKLAMNIDKATGRSYNVPLEDIDAIVFPTEVAEVVRHTFPSREGLVKGYTEYAAELESLSMIFDLDHRKKRN